MTSTPRRSALIVHAHPEPASFSTAQMHAAASALEAQGYRVDVLDLYELSWSAILSRDEFAPVEGTFKPQAEQMKATRAGTLPSDVQASLDAVLAADLLVLSFPLWWFSLPAILKGWVDRVFVMGATFGGNFGLFGEAALVGRRAVLLVTTGGPQRSFTREGNFGDIQDFLFHIHRGMLQFVGYAVLEPVITYGPAHLDDVQRARELDRTRDAFAGVDVRNPALIRQGHSATGRSRH